MDQENGVPVYQDTKTHVGSASLMPLPCVLVGAHCKIRALVTL